MEQEWNGMECDVSILQPAAAFGQVRSFLMARLGQPQCCNDTATHCFTPVVFAAVDIGPSGFACAPFLPRRCWWRVRSCLGSGQAVEVAADLALAAGEMEVGFVSNDPFLWLVCKWSEFWVRAVRSYGQYDE
jgi:hypothetical protein